MHELTFYSVYLEFEVVGGHSFVEDGAVELAHPLLLQALHLALRDAATDLRALRHSLQHFLVVSPEVVLGQDFIIVLTGIVPKVKASGIAGPKAKLLVEPICEVAITLAIALLLEGGLEINLELLRVAPGAALLLQHLAGDLAGWLLGLGGSPLRCARLLLAADMFCLLLHVPHDALGVEGVATIIEAHLLASVEACSARVSLVFVGLVLESVAASHLRADESAAARKAHQLLLLLLVLDVLIQEFVAFIALPISEEDSCGLVEAAVLEGCVDLLSGGPVGVEEDERLAAHFTEDGADHLSQLGKLDVLVVAHEAIQEHLELDVVQAALDHEVETRLEELLKVLDVLFVLLSHRFDDVSWLGCSRGELALLFWVQLREAVHVLLLDLGEQARLLQLDLEHRLKNIEPSLVHVLKVLALLGLLSADLHRLPYDVVEADDLRHLNVLLLQVLSAFGQPAFRIWSYSCCVHDKLVLLGLLLG